MEFSTQKRIKAEKNNDKDEKAFYKLMNNAIYRNTKGNLRYRISVKLGNNEKVYFECTSKPSYMPHKLSDNNLVAIRKTKLALKLNKPAYIGMCILELSKVLMYKFHYDYIKDKYDNKSKLLLTDTDSLIHELKTEDVYEDFGSNKEMLDFSNYSAKSKCYDNSNKLVISKMKDEAEGVPIEEFVGLKPKMYFFLAHNSEHKKANSVKRNVVATISHDKHKHLLFINKCIKHSINRIQGKDHRIGTYEIKKISLSCFDEKMYIQNNGYHGLALGYQS